MENTVAFDALMSNDGRPGRLRAYGWFAVSIGIAMVSGFFAVVMPSAVTCVRTSRGSLANVACQPDNDPFNWAVVGMLALIVGMGILAWRTAAAGWPQGPRWFKRMPGWALVLAFLGMSVKFWMEFGRNQFLGLPLSWQSVAVVPVVALLFSAAVLLCTRFLLNMGRARSA